MIGHVFARYERLEAEVTAGAERFDEIMRKWSEGKNKKIPQEIQELLHQQRAACSEMRDEKDKLINEFQQELKAKDDQYVKHLKKQAEDVDLVLERMEEQAKTLMKAYHEELTQIEKSFASERRELVDAQRAEWEAKMQARGGKEKEFLEERQKRIEKNEADVQHLRVRNAEEFNRIKIKLENDIQILQQQIQQMKATFQLNAEKLEYNFQVLKKRDEENTVTMSQQKRRITRLQDTLNTLKGKLSKQEKSCQDELQGLMAEYRKNTEQYRELQKKVKHFQTMDAKRFYDIWLMNEERVRSLAKDVANADETIHCQQLGLEWEPPATVESPMSKVVTSRLERDVSQATLYASQILSDTNNEKVSTPKLHPQTAGSTTVSLTPTSPALIKQVLNLLCEESGFLIESKLTRLLAPIDKDEQMLMKLDSIFKAIGIETEDDVHQLVKYFVCESTEDEHESSSAEKPLSLIHPNEVLVAIRRFVEACHGPSKAVSLTPQSMVVANKEKQDELLDGSFWERIAQVLPEGHERVWTALFEVRRLSYFPYASNIPLPSPQLSSAFTGIHVSLCACLNK